MPTALPGVVVVELEAHADERGLFARTYCSEEFAGHGLAAAMVQTNLSYSHVAGTLRGLHFQRAPAAEAKLVRCTRGRILDVAVDVRVGSTTYLEHVAVELDDAERRALYVPEGFAHGFMTLEDDTEVVYQVSAPYTPGAEGGVRWDDPALAIAWPREVRVISAKDAVWPLLEPGRAP